MSQNNQNDENTAIAMALGFIGAVMMVIAFAVIAILSFVAFVFTILAIIAWNEPLRLGRLVIEPEEARAFVYRGLLGAATAPAFLLFCAVLFGVPVEWNYFHYFLLGGYVAGSVGIEIAMAEENSGDSAVHPQLPQQVLPPRPAPQMTPPAEREPFSYARWDDEEENRR